MIQPSRFSFLLLLFLWPAISFAQSSKEDPTLFQLADEPFGVKAFNYYFLKNSDKPTPDSAKAKVNNYLELYVNFRLKVKEAVGLGEDQTPEFRQEFESYKKQLAEPYLMQTKVNDAMVAEAYARMMEEVSASHILVNCDAQANPEDTLKAYNKALGIKKRIENGEDFASVAAKESGDPSAKQNGGYLGYFSALQMVYPFETAVYENETGSIVGPVRTRFGYHIIEVKDKRKARGEVLTAHIMIRSNPDSASVAAAKSKANSVYQNLKNGADWNEQCRLYSDDMRTKSKGGQLQWFGTGNLVPEFENVAFTLKQKEDFSEPIQTRFGWHIIKLIDKKDIPPLDEIKADLESKISRDSRAADKKSVTLAKLKMSQNFSLNQAVRQQLVSYFDSSLLEAKWTYLNTRADLSQTIFSTNNSKFTIQHFFDFVQKEQKKRKLTSVPDYVGQLYNQFEEKSIFAEELKLVEANNYDYQMVLDEYRSGILLFNLMEKEVWNKAMIDSVGLEAFYEKNKKKNYQMAEHVVVRRFVSKDSAVLQSVSSQLSKTNSELDSLFNREEPLTLQTFDEKIEKGKKEWLDDRWEVGSSIQKGKNYYTLWVVESIQADGYKPLKDIKGLVISDYQAELEKQWLKTLSKKYPMKLNKPVLKSYIEEFER